MCSHVTCHTNEHHNSIQTTETLTNINNGKMMFNNCTKQKKEDRKSTYKHLLEEREQTNKRRNRKHAYRHVAPLG